MDPAWELAHINVARLRAPLDSPQMRELAAALDELNRLAESSPGFIWRLPSGHEVASDPLMFRNVSVWRSYEFLHAYVYRSAHGGHVRRRARWFVPSGGPSTALWWVPAGERPTAGDALRRFEHLRRYGPSPRAFTMRRRFTPEGRLTPRGNGKAAGSWAIGER